MTLKYIIFGAGFPVLFGDYFKHSDVSAPVGGEPTSAGMCQIMSVEGGISVRTYGESTALGLKPASDDAALIKALFQ